ncbi:MAG: hypothetical protein KAU90_06645 [Sulfurovaceae bacterium]|nr:hypothetical protein [Sulfurovaceae bacterium]
MNKIKTTKLLIASILMISFTTGIAIAKESKIAKGTTIGSYHKPGAPVDITYNTTRVKVNKIADINISLTTSLKSGKMEIKVDVDKNLEQIGKKYNSISFNLFPNQKSYDINMKVKGKKDGLYYIRLLVRINTHSGAKMRALAVPVYIGDGKLRNKSNQIVMKTMSGENISVSKAEETIEVIK